jgi:3-oxoacyl-[acyl-carrier protein] reductase
VDLGIKGRAALVAGASSGIGLASARALGAEGVRVALVARRSEESRTAANAIASEFGVEAHALTADLVERGECERVVEEAATRFGGLDILVPNCGGPSKGTFPELDDEAWRGAFELNYLTTVRMIREALPHMQKRSWGRIATIGSVVTQEPRAELTLSSGVRTGLVALTKILARKHAGEGITVNMVSPGYTMTQRTVELSGAVSEEAAKEVFAAIAREIPTGRFAKAEEIGAVVAFVCSQPAAFLNGINLVVDGAHTQGI